MRDGASGRKRDGKGRKVGVSLLRDGLICWRDYLLSFFNYDVIIMIIIHHALFGQGLLRFSIFLHDPYLQEADIEYLVLRSIFIFHRI